MVANAKAPGIIEGDILYTETEARERLGLTGAHAWRAAKRRGLVVRRSGKRNYIFGRDILDFVERTATILTQPAAEAASA
jgi:hypothetical protein